VSRKPWRRYLDPMNVAAYIAWIAIGAELMTSVIPYWEGGLEQRNLVLALHLTFLVIFVAVGRDTLTDPVRPIDRVTTLIQAVIALVMVALAPGHSAPVLLIIISAALFSEWRPRTAALILLAINVAQFCVFAVFWHRASPIVLTLMYAGFQLFAAVTSHYALRAGEASNEARAVNAHLLATRTLLAESARDQERLRLSRELHDVAGHKLTALKLNLTAIARDPRFADHAGVAMSARLAEELLDDIRAVVQQMRQHDGMHLKAAIAALAAPFPRPRVHLEISDDAQVESVAQADAIVRAVQEALTNAARHGAAENVWIRLRREDNRVVLDVRDDGRAGGTITWGNGLAGMRERLEALGGGVAVAPVAGGGVNVHAWLPVVIA
jgi:signal transduction histidine kinase